jgi:hypothetical protein
MERECCAADRVCLEFGRVPDLRGEKLRSGGFAEVGKYASDREWLGEERDEAHPFLAALAGERAELVDPCEQPGQG